jgi:uncharacterized secreted protein with C-terminal beta-propeller domain
MRLAAPVLVALLLGASLGGTMLLAPDGPRDTSPAASQYEPPSPEPESSNSSFGLVTADSHGEFRAYVDAARRQSRGGHLAFNAGEPVADTGDAGAGSPTPMATASADAGVEMEATQSGGDGAGAGGDDVRYGETNVQERGIDEPDVVKTVDGRFYYALPGRHERTHRDDEDEQRPSGTTVAIDARSPGDTDVTKAIDRSGRMLVGDDRVVVLDGDAVAGYDVTDPANPELVWEREVSGEVTAARLQNGSVYLVVGNRLEPESCEVEPVEGTDVDCTEIHHPERPVPVDVTYTAIALGVEEGETVDRLSFLGGPGSTVYMSKEGLYVTYLERTPRVETRLDYLLSDGRAVLDDEAIDHLEEVREYDLSPGAKREEVRATVERFLNRHPDERRELQEELRDGYREYVRAHKRDLDRTHVVRLSVDDGLSMGATGTVPGMVNDQFSFDVHEGHLRVATTVGERRRVESVNDVDVLETGNRSQVGTVTGMGEGQRVYGVRFVGDTGYVITFRQVDPLHVVDLSEPTDPEETGQLKLPGFSRYLHPLDDGRILGIGEQDGKVKAVVFDVSDPSDPKIDESRILDARFSAIERSHHAFTRDARHGVVFLPTERGGYVLSEDDLSTVARVDVERPQRARYAGDHLYVFGREEVAVVDERTWNRTETVQLRTD